MSEREKITIENIVASTSLAEHLDLSRIALALDGSEYEPEQFPGLIYRLQEPKTAVLIFRSGKVNCTGAKNLANVQLTIHTIIQRLKKAGIEVYDDPEIVVQNIVAVYDLEADLNLTDIAMSLGLENVEYEPEQFPALSTGSRSQRLCCSSSVQARLSAPVQFTFPLRNISTAVFGS